MIRLRPLGALAASVAAFAAQATPLSRDLTQDPSFSPAASHHCNAGYSYLNGRCHWFGPVVHHGCPHGYGYMNGHCVRAGPNAPHPCQSGSSYAHGGCHPGAAQPAGVVHNCRAGYMYSNGACRQLSFSSPN